MCELLVFAVDKVNSDFYKNCGNFKRGDVVVAMPDGHVWGLREADDPRWRILAFPDLPLASGQALCATEKATDPLHPSLTLQVRAFKLDLDALAALDAAFAAYLADNTRTAVSFPSAVTVGNASPSGTVPVVTSLKGASLTAATVQKPPIADPNIIGGSPTVIG